MDKTKAKIAIALTKAMNRPELLPYMREQLLSTTLAEFEKVSENEIKEYLSNANST